MSNTSNIYMPIPNIQVKMVGDWHKVTKGIDRLGNSIQSGYDKAINSFSKRLLRIIKEAIRSGGPPGYVWEPLSDSTLESYKSHGYNFSGKPYNRTGLFLRSIGKYSGRGRVYIGLPSRKRTGNGLTFLQLARVLENGTDSIPSRPLFSPCFIAAGGEKLLKRNIIKEIRSELYKLGFKSNQVKW